MNDVLPLTDSNNRIYGKFGYLTRNTWTRGIWYYTPYDSVRETYVDNVDKIYDIIKVSKPIFYILLNTAFQTFIETGENRFFLEETYIYQITSKQMSIVASSK